ncbi:hypothetical protein A3Q56_06324 [Intoshia linei]|uniref:Reverse transcriptase/retrotransposon-derived protein RNase H-like domain-containing protein n=1 Tax=Intoshia linei TaxID=1819745 RepID=A0A177AVE3_9BILA|nr:hypothetical protein A3Q56_06324 [Intoshia linei]
MTKLLKNNVKFHWNEEQEKSFTALKKSYQSAPLLAIPEKNLTFIIETDASNVGIRAVLLQNGRGIDELVRWVLYLDELDYELCYKPGKFNFTADVLSRSYNSTRAINLSIKSKVVIFIIVSRQKYSPNQDTGFVVNIPDSLNNNKYLNFVNTQTRLKHEYKNFLNTIRIRARNIKKVLTRRVRHVLQNSKIDEYKYIKNLENCMSARNESDCVSKNCSWVLVADTMLCEEMNNYTVGTY